MSGADRPGEHDADGVGPDRDRERRNDDVSPADEQALTALFASLVADAEPSELSPLEVQRLAPHVPVEPHPLCQLVEEGQIAGGLQQVRMPGRRAVRVRGQAVPSGDLADDLRRRHLLVRPGTPAVSQLHRQVVGDHGEHREPPFQTQLDTGDDPAEQRGPAGDTDLHLAVRTEP